MNVSLVTIWVGVILACLPTHQGREQPKEESSPSSIPTNTDLSIHRSYSKAQLKDYEQLQDSVRRFDEKSKSALIIIDAEDDEETHPERRSTIVKRSNEDFDEGFTIIVDREEINEHDVKKDKIYEEMEKSYVEIQQKFGDEIKQPVKEKHVRVIVITPKDELNEMEKDQPKEQQSELDLDIAKLQKMKENLKTLDKEDNNKEEVDPKLGAAFEDITPAEDDTQQSSDDEEESEKNKVAPSSPSSLVEEMEVLEDSKSKNEKNNLGTGGSGNSDEGTIESSTNDHLKSSTTISDSHITNLSDQFTSKQFNATVLNNDNTKADEDPPGNPHPQHLAIEEHYKAKAKENDHIVRNKSKKKTAKPSRRSSHAGSSLVKEQPHLTENLSPQKNESNITSVENVSSNTSNTKVEKRADAVPNIMEEQMKNSENKSVITVQKNETQNLNNHQSQSNKTLTRENSPKLPTQKELNIVTMPKTNATHLKNNTSLGDPNKKSQLKNDTSSMSHAVATNRNSEKTLRDNVISIPKAEGIIQFLNKDPLESWRFPYATLKALDLDAGLIRSGLIYPGYIDRLKGVMRRAITGENIILSIVGGSISAGGGLYKDRKSIDGLYYKGVVDWWNQWILPVTGSKMIVNNVAIGSIGTDYFSYCVKNHIKKDTNIVLWELAANDYNRYKTLSTKGARHLERFTRIVLDLPKKPALLYVNFFKGVDYKNAAKTDCPNFEDQQEHTVASYYHIPTLSWRAMVCAGLVQQKPGFLLSDLFSLDQYHPSLKGHAQSALLILLHLRHVMRAVLRHAIKTNGNVPKFEEQYTIPDPLFVGPKHPSPFCWSLIRPDEKDPVKNSLEVHIASNSGFSVQYATNFPIRFDKVVCWKSENTMATLKLVFTIPKTSKVVDQRYVVSITTHSRWGGSAYIWMDDKKEQPVHIQEGRPGDPGKRTQVDKVASGVTAGTHFLNLWSKDSGFCLAAIMINPS